NINRPDGEYSVNADFRYSSVNTNSGEFKYENKRIKHTHFIVKGENLYRLAQEFGCRISDLKNWNNLKSDKLRIGQTINYYMMEKVLVRVPDSKKIIHVQPKPKVVVAKPKPRPTRKKLVLSQLPTLEIKRSVIKSNIQHRVHGNESQFDSGKVIGYINRSESIFELAKKNKVNFDELIEFNQVDVDQPQHFRKLVIPNK
ncbi:MAG: LysM peptidoglycan-binding domain-containing protein, partial [Bacteroidota bacterium]